MRRVVLTAALLALLLSGLWPVLQVGAETAGVAAVARARAYANAGGKVSHQRNTEARFGAAGDAWGRQRPNQPGAPATTPAVPIAGPTVYKGKRPDQMPPTAGTPGTHAIAVALDTRLVAAGANAPGALTWYTSSEGVLTLGVPAHALDLGAYGLGVYGLGAATGLDAINRGTPVGPYTLVLRQTEGGFRGATTQLARFTLGVVDGRGRPLALAALAAPLTLRIRYQPRELSGLNVATLAFTWPTSAGPVTGRAPTRVPLTVDQRAGTLTARLAALGSGPLVLSATESDANPASSEHLTTSGNQGDLTLGLPLALPPAAGGLVPPLTLSYSSAGPNGRHQLAAPAGWVGDGWDLSLGSITFDTTTDLFYLNGVGGLSEPLLCCDADSYGNHFFVPHLHPEIRILTSDGSTNPQTTGGCFYMRLPTGLTYELGCTTDSRRTTVSGGALVTIEWDVDQVMRLANASGGLQQYNVHYWVLQELSGGLSYTEDAGIQEIDYNYNTSGSYHARVLFNIHWPAAQDTFYNGALTATPYGTNYHCASTPPQPTTQRCDDPQTPAGWEAAPLNLSTFTLDTINAQLWNNGTWQTTRQYQFTYNSDDPWTTCTDDLNGATMACAGDHTLARLQEVPYQNGAPMPSRQPITFTYTPLASTSYHDITENGYNGQAYTLRPVRRYLASYSDLETGAGANVNWGLAYGNTHGVPSGYTVTDPLICYTVGCANPDDRQWTRQVITRITDTGINATTTFQYVLNTPCGSACTQDTWIGPDAWNACGGIAQQPTNPTPACLEGSYQTFYNEEYTGFSQVYTTGPDGNTAYALYYAGNGWGTNDSDGNTLQRGHIHIQAVYQGAATGTPLAQTSHTYSDFNACPPAMGNNNALYNNPYMMCEFWEKTRYAFVGGTNDTVPRLTQSWTIADPAQTNHYYMQTSTASVTGDDLLADSFTNYGATQPTVTTNYSYIWNDGTLDAPKNNYYLIDFPAYALTTDSAGNGWACGYTGYDAQGFVTGQNSHLVDGLATLGHAYATCGTSGNGYAAAGGESAGTGYDAYGQPLVTTDADALTGGLASHVGCAPLTTPFVVYPTGQSTYTTCASYESAQNVYPATAANARAQSASTAWDVTQGVPTSSTDVNGLATGYGGPVYEYGGSPSLATYQDAYTRMTLPGETYGGPPAWTERVFAYSFCATASAQRPCLETDTVRQLDGTSYAVSRAFYDRDGRLVETRTLGPTAGQDTLTFVTYDNVNDKVFQSLPCQAATLGTSNGGRASTSTPGYIAPTAVGGNDGAYISPSGATGSCAGVAGTTTYADALGRAVASDDPLGTGAGTSGTGCLLAGGTTHHTTCAVFTAVAASASPGLPSGDSEPYLRTVTIDANLHQTATFADALGRVAYSQRFSGASQTALGSGIASYAVSTYLYDALGRLRQATRPSLPGPTFTYDATGRLTQSTDPNSGTTTYGYDPNGNLTSAVDARGPQGTTYAGYDGLDRPVWMGPNSTGTSPLAAWSYDGGTGSPCTSGYPVARLCQETFASGPGQAVTGSYTYTYDNRGRPYRTVMTLAGPGTPAASYTQSATYDDADRVATTTYPWVSGPTAETLTYGYTNPAGGALASLTSSLSSPTATLFTGVTYTTAGVVSGWTGGAAPDQAGESLSYDGDLRLAADTLTMTPSGGSATTVSAVAPGYDAAGNVASLTTTLAPVNGSGGGTETQAFCYDEQDRLVWASTQSTGSCGRGGSEGIAGAGYTASYGYDANGHVTSGTVVDAGGAALANAAQGGWTYTTTAPDALASVGAGSTGYSAAYDVNGDQTCRAFGAQSCANPTPTGEALTYDQLRRLVQWTNAAGTSTEQYAYDGEGARVWQQAAATSGGTTTTTTTSYVLGVQEWTSTAVTGQGPTTGTTSLYPLPGGALATRDSSGLTYIGSDALGTPVAAVNATSGVVGEQLFAPYGQPRYSASAPTNGGLHTSLGFTGQHADAGFPGASGLDYFEARYLDPVVGRFTSADDAHPGLGDPSGMDSYAYVQGMVESATDPTGHFLDAEVGGGAGGMSAAEGELALDAAANLEPTVVEFEGGVEGEVGDWVTSLEGGGADAASVDAAGGGEVVTPGDAPYSELGYREAEAQAADQAAADATPTPGDLPENQFRFEQEQEQLAHGATGGEGGSGSGGGSSGSGGGSSGPGEGSGGSSGSTGEPGEETTTSADTNTEPTQANDDYTRNKYRKFTRDQASSAKAKTEVCPYCNENDPNTVDHIESQKWDYEHGGRGDTRDGRSARINSSDNLIGACGPCNSSKGARPIGTGPGEWWPPAWPVGTWWPFGGP